MTVHMMSLGRTNKATNDIRLSPVTIRAWQVHYAYGFLCFTGHTMAVSLCPSINISTLQDCQCHAGISQNIKYSSKLGFLRSNHIII